MQKQIKGLAGRKPPVLTSDHSVVDTWLTQLMPGIQPLAAALDKTICQNLCKPSYAVKRGHVHYGVPALGCVVELAAYHVSVNVLFYAGADFDPPPPLGATDRTRYVKLTSLEEVERPELGDWIRQAGLFKGWT